MCEADLLRQVSFNKDQSKTGSNQQLRSLSIKEYEPRAGKLEKKVFEKLVIINVRSVYIN